tara:strand:+ start:473 stop:628 length:156 start_codon:yes stop_codon:yes gene_type:complete
MNYLVKFLSREEEKKVYTVSPPMDIKSAQKILKDLELMGMTAWLEESKNEL